MLNSFPDLFAAVSDLIWGVWTITLIFIVGLILSIRTRFVQFREFGYALKLIMKGAMGRDLSEKEQGDISPFQALTTALAATIGNGNVAGVATAITIGGPGAAFWMWSVALFGMATKYAECTLAVRYRKVAEDGTMAGGPMYYLSEGLKLKWLGVFFAISAVLGGIGAGNMTQSNSAALVLFSEFGVPKVVSGIILAFGLWLVIIGGIKRIGNIAEKLVPAMVLIYVFSSIIILIVNITEIPSAFALIFESAFTGAAAAGGFAGATVARAIAYGFRRGVVSSEAGAGSAAIAHGAAKTSDPHRQGSIAMVGVFIDTIVVSSMTALVIVTTGQWSSGLISTEMTAAAFNTVIPQGGLIIVLASVMFGFTTMVSWAYYGEQSLRFVFGLKISLPYRWIYCILACIGAIFEVKPLWDLGDIFFGLMIFPNLLALVGLSGVVSKLSMKK